MTHDEARLLLIDYFNGHLAEDEKQKLEKLMETDAAFRAEAAEMRRELHLLKSSVEDPWEDARLSNISEEVMKSIRQERQRGIGLLTPALRSYLHAAAAVLIIVIGFILFFLLRPQEGAAPLVVEQPVTEQQRSEEQKPEIVRLAIATDNPKVRIYWTLSSDFEDIGSE